MANTTVVHIEDSTPAFNRYLDWAYDPRLSASAYWDALRTNLRMYTVHCGGTSLATQIMWDIENVTREADGYDMNINVVY